MKLFLTSSGIPFSHKDSFLSAFSKPPHGIKLYFVPTAADVEPDGQAWVTKSENQFSEMGINPIWYNIAYKTENQMRNELADADCVWVNGGNTFYLLDVARKTGFMNVVIDLVQNKDVVYGGTSAGTILACDSIAAAGWKPGGDSNDVGITDMAGLSFLHSQVMVHYGKKYDSVIAENRNTNIPLYAIPDNSLLVVDGDTVTTVGDVHMYE